MTDTSNASQQFETVESLKAQLSDAQEKFLKQLKDVRAEKEFLANEAARAKSDASLVATRLDDAILRATRAELSEASCRKQMEQLELDCKEKMEQIRERQCDAPAIDETIFRNYRDLRALLHERCGAEFMSVHEQWVYARSTPLAVLERTRQWMLKFTECFQLVMLQIESEKKRAAREKAELTGALEFIMAKNGGGSPTSASLEGTRSNVTGGGGSADAGGGAKAITASPAVRSSSNQHQHSERRRDADARADAESIEQLNQRINVLRRECAQTKAELLRAHKSAHYAEQKQQQYQQMLEKAHRQLAEAIEASSSSTVRKQVDEVKRTMRAAIAAKDDEISSLKQTFEKDVVALTRQITSLNERLGEGDRLHAQLAVQKQENAALKSQLARMDVKSMQDHKKRADRELMELRSHTNNLESTVDTLRLRLSAAKQLATESKQKYSALFDAHLQEAKQRQTDAAKAKLQRIRHEVVGSDSALTKYHFEQKYQALVSELATTQQKLKRLIMIAHHDQVAHDAEIEQMQMQAVAYYERQQQKAENREELNNSNSRSNSPEQQQLSSADRSGSVAAAAGGGGGGNSSLLASKLLGATGRKQSVVDRNLFHATGDLRQQLQHSVIVTPERTTVEETARVVGEGKVQDSRVWQPSQQSGSFEVSSRTGTAAAVAKKHSDLKDYYDSREAQERQRNQKKVSISTRGVGGSIGSLSSHPGGGGGAGMTPGGGTGRARAATPDHSQKPPRAMQSSSQHSAASHASVQFFVEGAQSPMGVRERRVE